MNALTPSPSPLLKTITVITRWALGLMLSAWCVFAVVWGALHWVIVPRIGDLRGTLETQASRVLGVRVSIGAVQAQSAGLIPSFEFSDVKLFDAQGREALVLGRVVAALSPQSLLTLGFEQLYVDRPELDVRRTASGKFRVAGMDFSGGGGADDGSAANWVFSQAEVAIRHGTVHWTDELRGTPTLTMRDVDLVLRNHFRRHDARLDATPPEDLGTRFSSVAVFKQPLLTLHKGQWQQWAGQLYANFDQVDIARLQQFADLGIAVAQGRGALRAWVDVDRARVTSATADVTLADVSTTLGKGLAPLQLKSVTGQLGGRFLPGGFELSSHGLQFQTHDGLQWPGGNFRLKVLDDVTPGKTPVASRGELDADRLDLAALSQIANRLPLEAQTLADLAQWEATGLVENIKAKWQFATNPAGVFKYEAKGRVVGLAVISKSAQSPALHGATVDFDVNQAGGAASLAISNGAVNLPGVFDEPQIPLAQLTTDAKWVLEGERISVDLPNLKFSNADAQGEAQVAWRTSTIKEAKGRGRFPGALDLQGSMSRMQGNRVYRYMPSFMHLPVRNYLRDAIQKGNASGVKFKVKGNLYDMPFVNAADGEFQISARFNDANFAYVPESFSTPGNLPWPLFTQLSGDLLIDRLKLQIKGVAGNLAMPGGQPAGASLQISKADALIPDLLNNATVTVNAEARGELPVALGLLNASPLGQMIGKSLAQTTSSGNTDLKLKLVLPVAALDKTTVLGSVSLPGNDVQISPQTPLLSQAKGSVSFTENGFALNNVSAHMMGGDMVLAGGSLPLAKTALAPPTSPAGAVRDAPDILLRAQGSVSAEGLRQAKDLGLIARIAQQASGNAAYSAVLGFRHGIPELLVNSNLAGMALALPQPLGKSAESSLPLRLETSLVNDIPNAGTTAPDRWTDRIQLDLGRVGSLTYIRDVSATDVKVLRGSIGVGLAADEAAPLPPEGVVANVNLPQVDLDAWAAVLSQAAGARLAAPQARESGGAMPATATNGAAQTALGYLPTIMAVRAGELTVGARKFNHVVVGGSREGLTWRANMDAAELNGYAEYRQSTDSGAGRVYARLARLTLAQSSAKDVESILDEQPASVPALDIVVDDLELRGKRMGRVEIEAVNLAGNTQSGGVREWRLNKFNVLMPEAIFTATGNWAKTGAAGPPATNAGVSAERRRTAMNFKLDINDTGELLNRFGMKDVVRRGKGTLEGQVAWMGSPLAFDYPSMVGAFAVNVETGQFLKAEPGLAKLLGVLSLQSLPRRLALDFRDVFSDGFSFDFVRGDVAIDHGIASTNNLQMKGVNAAVLMDGRADIAKETQDIRVVVVPEINAGTASLIATVINPAIGLGTFLAQLILRRPLMEASTQEFHIDGSWVEPVVTRVLRKSETGNDNTSKKDGVSP
jgi:uncharacterized protein (TIGR02099 family)